LNTVIRTPGCFASWLRRGFHPVGATGVRQLLDAHLQVTGEAGDYQVEGARNVQTLNIGGSGTTSVSFIVGV
jgi:acetyl-CoA C-acetyltransferase